MFLKRNKNKFADEKVKKPVKKWKRVLLAIFIALLVLIASYIAYLYATGQKIFDAKSLTASPFFKKISGENYKLKGEGDGRINIVLLGMGGAKHPGGSLTDSIMVVSIDPTEKSMAMLSIPRDLYVPIPNQKYSRKINELYKIGEDKKKDYGGVFAKEAIGNILDLPIHYYVTVDFYGFVKVIDEVGGIKVEVDKALYDPLFPDEDMKGYDTFSVKAGAQTMDGETALKYARSRQTSSDFDRAARQQKVIEGLREKLLSKGYLSNPKNILSLVKIASDHVRTDFTQDELLALAELVKDMDLSKTVSKVLSNGTDGELVSDSSSGTYLLLPKDGDWTAIKRIAHEIFTDPDLKKENAKIEVINGTAISGQAKKLADTLISYNYSVVSIINGDKTQKTVINDYSNGKKAVTVAFLEKRLGVVAKKVSNSSNSEGIDISIVIGDDYKGFNQELSSE